MAKYTLKRKTYSIEAKQAFAEKQAGTLKGSLADRVSQLKAGNAANSAKQAVERVARKEVGNTFQREVGSIAQRAGQKGYQAGLNKGIQSAGIRQGVMNTWRSAGAMGKTGMAAAGVAGVGLLAKGLFGGDKSKQAV